MFWRDLGLPKVPHCFSDTQYKGVFGFPVGKPRKPQAALAKAVIVEFCVHVHHPGPCP